MQHPLAKAHNVSPQTFASSPEVVNVVNYLEDNGQVIEDSPVEKITAYLGFLANEDYFGPSVPEMNDTEVSFLYGTNSEFDNYQSPTNGIDRRRSLQLSEVKAKRGESDYDKLAEQIREQIHEQIKPAGEAYETVVRLINLKRDPGEAAPLMAQEEVEAAISAKLSQWQNEGVFRHLAKRKAKYHQNFNLVATPNISINISEVALIGKSFNMHNSPNSSLWASNFEFEGEELSTITDEEALILISLIPDRNDPELYRDTISETINASRDMQAIQPELKLHFPGVLEGLSYMYSLRKAGTDYVYCDLAHFDIQKPASWNQAIPGIKPGMQTLVLNGWGKYIDYGTLFVDATGVGKGSLAIG